MSETEAMGKPEKAIQDLDYSVIIYCWLKAYVLAVVLNPVGLGILMYFFLASLFDGSLFSSGLGDVVLAVFYYFLFLFFASPFFLPALPLSLTGVILVKRAGEARLKIYLLSGLAIAFVSFLVGMVVTYMLAMNQAPSEDPVELFVGLEILSLLGVLSRSALIDLFQFLFESSDWNDNIGWSVSIINALLFCLPPGAIGGYLFHRFLMRVEE